MKYMLDTNMCIYIIKKHPDNVFKRFKTFDVGDICISSITFAELMYGVHKSHHQQKNKIALELFSAPLEIVPFDGDTADHYGGTRTYLEKNGTPIGSLDMMIAAHALSLNLILVTNNTKKFSRVPHLKIEDWTH
jgi:tRNA(fMet)-specific endonuclease VapC